MTKPRGLFATAIILYFVIALEMLIMISPFAAFLYAVFNPVLLWFALRAFTVARLPLWSQGRTTALTILPGDSVMLEQKNNLTGVSHSWAG